MRRTKIVCTIGPSSQSPDVLRELIQSGMNVARMNFSHGTHDEHLKKIERIRQISRELDTPVAILQDLCGPKIRTGIIEGAGIELVPGKELILTNEEITGTGNRVSVSYANLPQEVKTGDSILLADGMFELSVKDKTATDIFCEIVHGGLLTSHKGINLPGTSLSIPALTEKDKEDLSFGLKNDVDFVALSFVKSSDDVMEIKDLIKAAGKDTPVISKIEKHEAIENIDKIMEATDGIMVARGDLGVEIPLEDVPGIQKMLVKKAVGAGKPVIIATQMLRSMVDSPRPTRAEAADVANAVLDGTDALMLSEETANGDFPVEALGYMAKIALKAEDNYRHDKFLEVPETPDIAASVSYAASVLAESLHAKAIVASTKSGFTAKQISRCRPDAEIIALSPDKRALRQLCLCWGCVPSYICDPKDTDEMIEKGTGGALRTGLVREGDTIIITAGHPMWVPGTTNMVKVKQI
ncbi:MAG: pyruvate kinase [Desulfobacteraceae bacterium]|nr:pyruvate kinase [Desulfobacteraceae bacterium]